MTTDSAIAARPEPTATAAAPEATAGRGPRARKGWAGVVRWTMVLGTIAGLIGFNAWWYRRDTRPLADPRTIEGWIARGESARAESELVERLRRAPHDVEGRMTLSRALAARGDMVGCARELAKVPYWSPKRAEAALRSAQAFLMADRAREAEAALLSIMDADPLHPPDPGLYHDAGQELLKLYVTEDRWEDAYPIIWMAFDHAAPVDRPAMLSMRIRSALERVSPVENARVLRRYVAADPSDHEALRSLANAELAISQGADALRHMEDCLRARPEDPRVWRDYLTMLQSLGEQDAFRAAMGRVPPSAESEPEIWMFRGELKEREGDFEGALADYRRALERNPNLTNAHYRLATIEARLGRREQAASHRKRWAELRDAQVRLRRADAEFRAALAAASAAEPGPTAQAEFRAATKRLGAVCEALGWARAADACRRIVMGH